tara:strand:+ start:2236 stop:3087 length:852 start_codon:yes stop_codon:yes gene_type:complete
MHQKRRHNWKRMHVHIDYGRVCAQCPVGIFTAFDSMASIVEAFACVRTLNRSVVSSSEGDLLRPTSVLTFRCPDGSDTHGIVFRSASVRLPALQSETPLVVGQTLVFPGCPLRPLVVAGDPPHAFRYMCMTSLDGSLDAIQATAVDQAGRLIGERIDGRGRSFLDTVASRSRCIANSHSPPGLTCPPPWPPTGGAARAWPLPESGEELWTQPARTSRAGGFGRPHFKRAEDLFCYFAEYWVENETGKLTSYFPGITRKTHWPLPLVCNYLQDERSSYRSSRAA